VTWREVKKIVSGFIVCRMQWWTVGEGRKTGNGYMTTRTKQKRKEIGSQIRQDDPPNLSI
jgi:hypothetical protein